MRSLRFYLYIIFLMLCSHARTETVALWLFDDPVEAQKGALIKDASGNGLDLELGDGKIVADGKFGNGLSCPPLPDEFTARRLHVQGTPLNLGNWDWTVEWWQRRDGPIPKGYVDWVYLTADQSLAAVDAQSSWELGFQAESRFLGMGVWHHTHDWMGQPVRLNVFADKHDEVHKLSLMHEFHPAFYAGTDPDFHHIAWVYDAQTKRLMYFEDGEGPVYVRDGTSVAPGTQKHSVYGMMGMEPLADYPETYEVYNATGDIALYIGGERSIGPDRETAIGIEKIPEGYRFVPRPRAGQQAHGIIDEMRVSKGALYHEPFTPPQSFAEAANGPWLSIMPRRLDFVATKGETEELTQTFVIENSGTRNLNWKIATDAPWIRCEPAEGHAADKPTAVTIAVDPSELWADMHQAKIEIRTSDANSPPQSVEVNLNVQGDAGSLWLFDEPLDAPHRFRLEDQTVNGFDLTLGPGGEIVEGKFGHALNPRGKQQGQAAICRYIDPTHLNLGERDWTWEMWLNVNEPPDDGDVLFMASENILIGPIYPYYREVGPVCGVEIVDNGRALRFISERSGINDLRLKTDSLIMTGQSPGWHHFALCYDSTQRSLSHWMDGVLQDSVGIQVPLQHLQRTGENTLSIGKSLSGERAFGGLMDEMRVSMECRYHARFTPPASFAPVPTPIPLKAGPHLLIDDFLVSETRNLRSTTHRPEYPVEKPQGWDVFARYIAFENQAGAGEDCPDPNRRYIQTNFLHSQSNTSGVAGTVVHYGPTPDGPWINYEGNPAIPFTYEGQPGAMYAVVDAHPVFYDKLTQQFVMLFKSNPMNGENPELAWYRDERWNAANRIMWGYRRVVGMTTSKDGLHWENRQQVFTPDDNDPGETQFQWAMLFRRGDHYLVHQTIHHDDVDRSVSWTTLATSTDLYHWTRHREPFIPFGEGPTRGDKLFVAWGNKEFFIQDDFMYLGFFVQGSHKPPRRQYQGVARLPLDRFISRDSIRDETGLLRTPPVLIDPACEQMQLNALVAQGGEIRVQALDASGNIILGYAYENCDPIVGDAIRHTVTWQGSPKLAFPKIPIQLEFRIAKGQLFAFYLTDPDWSQDKNTSVVKDWPAPDSLDFNKLLEIKTAVTTGDHAPLTVSESRLNFLLHKDPALAYSGAAPERTFTVTPADASSDWYIVENVPWLNIEPNSGRGAEGPIEVRAAVFGVALRPGKYLGKFGIHIENSAEPFVQIPVVFDLIED